MYAASFLSLKENIINNDLCTSCSLCVAACPKELLSMSHDAVPLPLFQEHITAAADVCGDCRLCSDICPGYDTGTSESELRIFGRNRTEKERWVGIHQSVHQLAAIDPAIINKVAAGGAGTILAITALEEKLVDAMIVVGRDEASPWIPKAYITDSIEKVIECAQSSYCITPNLELLKDPRYNKIGIIGMPCQIQGVNKLLNLKHCPEAASLAEKVVFTLELGCASSTSLEGTEHLITSILNVKLEDVAYMRYRDGEYPGKFVIRTKEGTEHALPFYRLVEEFKKYKTFRCLSCPDWWSGIADISIADGDPNIFDSSKTERNTKPTSTVMVRTQIGQRLIQHAQQRSYIELYPYYFENNLGLERKRQRYRSYVAAGHRVIPLPSGVDADYTQILSDDEVIRNGIGDEKAHQHK
ncbi:Coenzyme F420 hydrogenase/dehydrogenase, beta subunit C-terminal domain [Paenibacillus fonticola]|uniref:Coenzyme F420 hydrogenase/dehydrogenase, beta subunit C-terminal domain n=1 Tax=Paenibacillus fonticola TaxID=379896 RepID=UPI00035CD38B|nr:Coenzyme F420 hydrogenase/dehydrogenase, beta subunit C-terminal domain [Paenibacillus fonticola]